MLEIVCGRIFHIVAVQEEFADKSSYILFFIFTLVIRNVSERDIDFDQRGLLRDSMSVSSIGSIPAESSIPTG